MKHFRMSQPFEKVRKVDLPLMALIHVFIPAGASGTLTAVGGGKGNKILLAEYKPGSAKTDFIRVDGAEKLEIVQNQEPAITVKIGAREIEEPFNHDQPPPRKEPNSFLGKLRSNVQNQLHLDRETFLMSQGLNYEIDDDEPEGLDTQFEEEITEKLAKQLEAHQLAAAGESLASPDEPSTPELDSDGSPDPDPSSSS